MLNDKEKAIAKCILSSDAATFEMLVIGFQIAHGLHAAHDFLEEANSLEECQLIESMFNEQKIACCRQHLAEAYLRMVVSIHEAQIAIAMKTRGTCSSLEEALQKIRGS